MPPCHCTAGGMDQTRTRDGAVGRTESAAGASVRGTATTRKLLVLLRAMTKLLLGAAQLGPSKDAVGLLRTYFCGSRNVTLKDTRIYGLRLMNSNVSSKTKQSYLNERLRHTWGTLRLHGNKHVQFILHQIQSSQRVLNPVGSIVLHLNSILLHHPSHNSRFVGCVIPPLSYRRPT